MAYVTTIALDSELTEIAMELEDAKTAKAEAAQREKAARDKLVEALKAAGAEQGTTVTGLTVALSTSTRQTVNSKKLEAMFPDTYAQVISVSEVETLRLI